MTSLRDRLIPVPLYLFALAAPISVGYGNAASGLVMITAALCLLTARGRDALPPRALIWAVLACIGVHALATLLADPFPQRWDKLVEEMWLKLLILAVPIVVGRDPERARRAVRVLLLLGTAVGVYVIYQHFFGRDLLRGRELYTVSGYYTGIGFFNHHLTYGGQALILWSFATAWTVDRSRVEGRVRILPALCALILAIALFWSYARSAIVGAVAGAFALVLLMPQRRRVWGLGAFAVLVGLAAALPSIRIRFAKFLESGNQETRLNLWQSSLDGLQARPLLGFGPGNFGYLMENHGVEGFYDTKAHSHNDFLMHGANAGLLGLAAALAVIVVSVWLLWRARDLVGDSRWLLTGGITAQVAISIAGLFQVYQTDDEVEMVLYFTLGCAMACLPRPRGGTGPPDR